MPDNQHEGLASSGGWTRKDGDGEPDEVCPKYPFIIAFADREELVGGHPMRRPGPPNMRMKSEELELARQNTEPTSRGNIHLGKTTDVPASTSVHDQEFLFNKYCNYLSAMRKTANWLGI